MVSVRSNRTGAQRSLVQLVALGLLFLQFATVAEAGKFSKICNFLICSGKDDDAGGLPAPRPAAPIAGDANAVKCPNPAAPTDENGWGISKLTTFPTVEQIMEDYKLCGICSDPTSHSLFYTFGGGTSAANTFKNMPQNKALNLHILADCMPQSFVNAANKMNGMDKANGPAQVLWIIRNSQAFARLSAGEVYVVTNGKGTPQQRANIYTSPYWNQVHAWMGRHNVWYDYEFGELQRNTKVTAVYTVPNDPTPLTADKTGEGAWIRGSHDAAARYINADTVTEDEIQKKMNAFNALPDSEKAARMRDQTCNNGMEKRGADGVCTLPGKSSTTSGSHTTLSTKTKSGTHTATATGAHATKTATKTGQKTPVKTPVKTPAKTPVQTPKKGATKTAHKGPKKTPVKSQKITRCRIGQEC